VKNYIISTCVQQMFLRCFYPLFLACLACFRAEILQMTK
jgi:hypothetical protein